MRRDPPPRRPDSEELRSFRNHLVRRIEKAEADIWREEDSLVGEMTSEIEAVRAVADEARVSSPLLARVATMIGPLDLSGECDLTVALETIGRFDESRGVDVRIGEPDEKWETKYGSRMQEPEWVAWSDIERFVPHARDRVMALVALALPVLDGLEFGSYEDSPREYSGQ